MNEFIGFSNIIILIVTLIVIGIYTRETYKLRIINSKILEIEREKLKPNIIAYFDYNPIGYEIFFKVKNIGGGVANNVLININPELTFGSSRIENHIIFRKDQRNISVLPSNTEFSVIVGYSVEASERYKKNEIPIEYDIEINYYNSEGDNFIVSKKLSIHHLFWRILHKDYLIEEFKNTNKILNEIKKILDK